MPFRFLLCFVLNTKSDAAHVLGYDTGMFMQDCRQRDIIWSHSHHHLTIVGVTVSSKKQEINQLNINTSFDF